MVMLIWKFGGIKMIKYSEDRGQLNKDNIMKVHYNQESFWIKVVAVDRDFNKVIGILMNSLLDNEVMTWGTMVMAQEIDTSQLCEVQYVVDSIPNNDIWTII
jgi:hypothetical protein